MADDAVRNLDVRIRIVTDPSVRRELDDVAKRIDRAVAQMEKALGRAVDMAGKLVAALKAVEAQANRTAAAVDRIGGAGGRFLPGAGGAGRRAGPQRRDAMGRFASGLGLDLGATLGAAAGGVLTGGNPLGVAVGAAVGQQVFQLGGQVIEFAGETTPSGLDRLQRLLASGATTAALDESGRRVGRAEAAAEIQQRANEAARLEASRRATIDQARERAVRQVQQIEREITREIERQAQEADRTARTRLAAAERARRDLDRQVAGRQREIRSAAESFDELGLEERNLAISGANKALRAAQSRATGGRVLPRDLLTPEERRASSVLRGILPGVDAEITNQAIDRVRPQLDPILRRAGVFDEFRQANRQAAAIDLNIKNENQIIVRIEQDAKRQAEALAREMQALFVQVEQRSVAAAIAAFQQQNLIPSAQIRAGAKVMQK